jgi:pyridoxamine 5'-phosphate oxidase
MAELMSCAPWRSAIASALHRNRSLAYARYLQLATIAENHRPANRTVVFRGFLTDSDQLQFIADTRSEKIPQIQQQPWSEACWYFPTTREQFRLTGQLSLIDAQSEFQSARQKLWQDLSDNARLQFAWPNPGQPRSEATAFTPANLDPSQPLANFCLMLLDPIQVDHLELRGEPQNRWLYRRDDQTWSKQEINP